MGEISVLGRLMGFCKHDVQAAFLCFLYEYNEALQCWMQMGACPFSHTTDQLTVPKPHRT
jgi:hypothetical protein